MDTLRIGFDVSPLHRPHSRGITRLVEGLVGELERRGTLEVVRLAPQAGEDLRRWRQSTLPDVVRERELVGLHSLLTTFPLRGGGKRVQTIHELPWRHGVKENADWKHRMWVALGPLRADRVVTACEHVAKDIRRRALPGASKLRVIPWGVGAPFAGEPPLGEVDEVVLGHYRLCQDPLVLCPGAVRAKKNLAAVLRGLAALRERGGPNVQLVVTGEHTLQLRKDLGLVSQLGLNRFVSTPGPIDEAHLPALLRLTTAVPVLSPSEGFAFPVLEAMASGTPVVVPRDSAQAELAGSVGIAVDAADPNSVADGLARAIEEREALRLDLVERAAEFTWTRCAERVEALWEELA